MRELACDFVHLGFADAIYRTSPVSGQLIYRDSRERLAAPPIDDAGHVEEPYLVLRRLALDLGNVLVLSPLGIGQHVDHAICARIALRLFGASPHLLFYEDFPYVLSGPRAGLPDDGPRQAIARLGRTALGRHRLAIDAEANVDPEALPQPDPLLFGDEAKLAASVRGHGRQGRCGGSLLAPGSQSPPERSSTLITQALSRDIHSQPTTLERHWQGWQQQANRLAPQLASRRSVVLVGRGSSAHACTFGSHIFAASDGPPPDRAAFLGQLRRGERRNERQSTLGRRGRAGLLGIA